jgi:uncharacterized protein YecE (DUF72 family)
LGPPRPDGWVFFNNDHQACAVRNATTFESMLEGEGSGAAEDEGA